MKRMHLFIPVCLTALFTTSCNDSSDKAGDDRDTLTGSAVNQDTSNMNTNTAAMNMTPFTKMDSTFVIQAAIGSMLEVESGNLAQQKGVNQRVKDYGAMMVRDHGQANNELRDLASRHGFAWPAALPADKQKHIDDMNKLSGKAFDQHYVNMMVNDHKTAVSDFKKASEECTDNDLKSWAGKTLPVLQSHLDSIQAIKKIKL